MINKRQLFNFTRTKFYTSLKFKKAKPDFGFYYETAFGLFSRSVFSSSFSFTWRTLPLLLTLFSQLWHFFGLKKYFIKNQRFVSLWRCVKPCLLNSPLLFVIFLSAGCETQEDLQNQVQELIEQRLEDRMLNYTTTLNKKCMERVMEEAARVADSILIAEARLKKDTIGKPLRPDRPKMPEIKKSTDTAALTPLFEEIGSPAKDSSSLKIQKPARDSTINGE